MLLFFFFYSQLMPGDVYCVRRKTIDSRDHDGPAYYEMTFADFSMYIIDPKYYKILLYITSLSKSSSNRFYQDHYFFNHIIINII